MRISDWSSDVCSSDLAEQPEQFAGFVVRSSRGGHDHIHSAHRVDAAIVDLGEDDLFLEAAGIVAPTVEAVRRHAAKDADAGHRDGDTTVEKFEHQRTAQGNHTGREYGRERWGP